MSIFFRFAAIAVVACACACSRPPEQAVPQVPPSALPPPVAPAAPPAPPPGPAADPSAACDLPHDSVVEPDDGEELALALAEATPGTMIRLREKTYAGRFVARNSGTLARPIVLCGPRGAVLDGGAHDTGYVLHLDGADRWTLSGFTVRHGKKGIVLDEADFVLITGLLVHDIGEEAVHFRDFSSDNVMSHSEIRDTGRYEAGYGEGAYVGSAISHWRDSATPDRSDRNQLLHNKFGPGVAAEHIDLKEGTSGGVVRGNVFDGRGMTGANYADSWIDVKGNNWRIEANSGTDALRDGFQVHARVDGWGNDNVFTGNAAAVNGPGYGFALDEATTGNVVACDNIVSAAGAGASNVACRETAAAPGTGTLDASRPPSGNFDLTRWKLTLPSGGEVQTDELASGFCSDGEFHTDPASGGMTFRTPNLAGTTANSTYSRSELREMLAPGHSSGSDENNWTTAEGGTLKATLRVDHVSTTGDDAKVGRVVIGQIHGVDSEPIRLYFHKKPGEARARIYAAHDTAANVNAYSPDIVPNANGEGIALGEIFSYEIRLVDTRLTVVIRRPSGPDAVHVKDIDPAYRGENLYFKAGVYNQNNTGDAGDYVQATFLALTHTHP